MNDKDYFSYLYEIAKHLNKADSLHSALQRSLEKTVDILDLETAWIWLTEKDNSSVYLAASYNLPPALRNHPERLSGWCYCIKEYFAEDIGQAYNVSEITCSRLKDISSGTNGLKSHAVIPITIHEHKVGLMNLLSKESRPLSDQELAILNTISELVGTAIQRTRLKESYRGKGIGSEANIKSVLEQVFQPQVEALISSLKDTGDQAEIIADALTKAKALQSQLQIISKETKKQKGKETNTKEFLYPETPLTKRELEVLSLIKQGLKNSEIGQQLYITERTVKFHVTSILSKLHANTRTEAVRIGLQRGFLHI